MKWSRLSQSEFYFYAGANLDPADQSYGITTWVVICPVSFFEEHGFLIDQYLGITDMLPDYSSEEGDALFSSNKSIEETRQDFLKLGFKESEQFSLFCKTHDPFCSYSLKEI